MSIVVTIGYQYSGAEDAHGALTAAGLIPARASEQKQLSPSELTRTILSHHSVEFSDPTSIRQVLPSRVGEALFVDLMLANMRPLEWGWYDPNGVYLLDFWHGFDHRTKFCFIYSSPRYAVSRFIANDSSSFQSVERCLSVWLHYNTELLRFYHRNRERSLLVNIEALVDNPDLFHSKCRERLNLELQNKTLSGFAHPSSDPNFELVAAECVKGFQKIEDFYRELETSSDMPYFRMLEVTTLAWRARDQYRDCLERLEGSSKTNAETITKLENQNAELGQTLRGLMEKNQRLQRRVDEFAEVRSNPQGNLTDVVRQNSGVEKENRLLTLQLQQVQEELKYYFDKYNSLKESWASGDMVEGGKEKSFLNVVENETARTVETIIDMRQLINGDNWYHPEHDGRWTGPGTTSTVHLPDLPSGRYRLELDLVDAAVLENIRKLEMNLNGEPLRTRRTLLPNLHGPLAAFKRVYVLLRRFRQTAAWSISAEIDIDRSKWKSPLILELSVPAVVSPSTTGSHDTRKLGIRVRQIRIIPN